MSTVMPEQIDIARFHLDPGGFAPYPVTLVVKSQDQVERRRALIQALSEDRIGRIAERPVAEGLVVRAVLEPGCRVDRSTAIECLTFREPRGLIPLPGGGDRLVSEIDQVLQLDSKGAVERTYRHPLFGFLHSLALHADGRRLLVVSSGYDLLTELDLDTGAVVWDWLTWEHGFNPGLDGIWLARRRDLFDRYGAEGHPARLIVPEQLGAHGLMTSARTNHPNSACYHPDGERILATLGHSGEVVEIERNGRWRTVVSGLASMPHGIRPYAGGWMVTDTLRGECRVLSEDYQPRQTLVFAGLPGKPPELAGREWLQMVQPLDDRVLLALDANRGLILVDPVAHRYAVVPVDENWCVHLAVPEAIPPGR